MKLLVTVLIWCLAILFAGLIILKLLRGRPVLVRGTVGRKAIRIAAMALVFTGTSGLIRPGHVAAQDDAQFGEQQEQEKERPAEPVPHALKLYIEKLPTLFMDRGFSEHHHAILLMQGEEGDQLRDNFRRDRRIDFEAGVERLDHAPWTTDYLLLDRLGLRPADQPEVDYQLLQDTLRNTGRVIPRFAPDDLVLIWLAYQDQPAAIDDDFAASQLIIAMGQLEERARVYYTAKRALAQARIRPVVQNEGAWRSKGGPGRGAYAEGIKAQREEIEAIAIELYPQTDGGEWRSECLVQLRQGQDSPPVELIRRGEAQPFAADKDVAFARLDLIRTGPEGGTVVSPWLGEMVLPANAVLRISDLPGYLTAPAKQKIAAEIRAVLHRPEPIFDDDVIDPRETAAQQAAVQLERHLPLVMPMLQASADEHKEAYGAATLRTLINEYQLPGIELPR